MHDQVTETVDRPLASVSRLIPLRPGTIFDQRYQIHRDLGQGGSAIVYAAHDLKIGQDVALKILRSDRISETAVKRLRREVGIARRTADPRLIRIFDIAESDAGPYLTMELLDAPTLRTWLQGRRLEIEEVVALASEILEAIAALHALGIVHRDIKPSNLLIGADGHVKLGDFGLALHLDADESRLTQTAALVGTLEYLSPEQALGAVVDQRSDLYSFGVLLFEMLTGRLPFESVSSIGTVVAQVSRNAPDVRKFRPDTPRWLAGMIAGLLEKDPSRRFADVDAVRAVMRRRRLPLGRAVPWMRTMAAAIVTAAFIVAGTYVWLDHRFSRLVHDGNVTLSAVDRGGRTLWTMSDVRQQFNNAIVRQNGKPKYIAIVHDHGLASDLSRNHDLLLVDPQGGQIVRRVRLPDAASSFPDFSRDFHADSFVATDLDGRGNDVVVLTYCHKIYWPSYTVVYDPQSGSAGTVFYGSGHHRYAGAVDVNGDGRKELILTGINNRMGWATVLAAIDIRSSPFGYQIASSPDARYASAESPLWYTLLPAGHGLRVDNVDETRKRISLAYDDGRTASVNFDGFIVNNYHASLFGRVRRRQAAYDDLRETLRLSAGGFAAEAIAASERAYRSAIASEDSYLIEWTHRTFATMLANGARIEDADREFDAASSSSSSQSEVAFDAARALHLAGALDRAIRWYNRGLGVHSTHQSGRGRYEFLEGEVLALGELKRWDDALGRIARFEAEFADRPYPEGLREYVKWRMGEKIDKPLDPGDSTTDLLRYWRLEILHRNGAAPAALLDAIEQERQRSSGDTLLLTLKAEILGQIGRYDDAQAAARNSYQSALIQRRSDTAIRAHFDLIASRFAHWAR